MYVCICQSVTDKDIAEAVAEGVDDFAELQACTACSTSCGCCEPLARKVFAQALDKQQRTPAVLPPLLAVA